MSLDSRLKVVFADAFETTPEAISDTLTVENSSADWDSMRSIVLATSIEAEFGIEFTDDELVTLDGYQKILRVLSEKGVS